MTGDDSHESSADESPIHVTHQLSDSRSLSEDILAAVETYADEDITFSEFTLYDSLDPDALNNLFRVDEDAEGDVTVAFNFADTKIHLEGNGTIDITVTDGS